MLFATGKKALVDISIFEVSAKEQGPVMQRLVGRVCNEFLVY